MDKNYVEEKLRTDPSFVDHIGYLEETVAVKLHADGSRENISRKRFYDMVPPDTISKWKSYKTHHTTTIRVSLWRKLQIFCDRRFPWILVLLLASVVATQIIAYLLSVRK